MIPADYSQLVDVAVYVYTATIVLIAVMLMLMSSMWKSLKEFQAVLPSEKRHILRSINGIRDNRERLIVWMRVWLVLGIMYLWMGMGLSLSSLVCVSGLMTGQVFGPFSAEQLDTAQHYLFGGVVVLIVAFFYAGLFYLWRFVDVASGRLYLSYYSSVERRGGGKERWVVRVVSNAVVVFTGLIGPFFMFCMFFLSVVSEGLWG